MPHAVRAGGPCVVRGVLAVTVAVPGTQVHMVALFMVVPFMIVPGTQVHMVALLTWC